MNCVLRSYNARRAEASGKNLTLVDKIILMRSDPLVHAEYEFSRRHEGISWSATMQDGANCCRFKKILYSHPERWTNLVLAMTDEQEDRAYERAVELEGMPYDLIGLGSFATDHPIIKPHPDKYWCSEACAELIVAGYELDDLVPSAYHPVGLFFEMFHRRVGYKL